MSWTPGMAPGGVPEEVAYRLSNGLPIGIGSPGIPSPPSPEAVARRRAAVEEWEEGRRAWVETCREQLSALPLPARIACVMTVAAAEGFPAHQKFQVFPATIAELAPELGVNSDEDMTSPSWDDDVIACWFADACKEPAQRVRLEDRKSVLGRWKEQFTDGWVFNHGSTMLWEHPGGESRWFLHRGVSSDGRPLYGNIGIGASPSFERHQSQDRYSAITLQKMARMAGLAPLPTAPQPPR